MGSRGIARRSFCLQTPLFIGAAWLVNTTKLFAAPTIADLESILSEVQKSDQLIGDNREYREAFKIPGSSLEQAPATAKPSNTKISPAAIDLIITFEVSSPKAYERRYKIPLWPGGQSGVTIGVGYDVGYTTKENFIKDWQREEVRPGVDLTTLQAISSACGLKKDNAASMVSSLSQHEIPWESARSQFEKIMLPRYVGMTERSLPNFKKLTESCRGALVSLVYNRGPSFLISEARDPTNRYDEMRQIRAHMISGKIDLIPNEIRKMKHLWDVSKLPGLHKRRDAEAVLFEIGLQK